MVGCAVGSRVCGGGVLDECGFFVELCFHVVFVVLLFCFGGYFVRKSVMARGGVGCVLGDGVAGP